MNFFIGVTDYEWFQLHAAKQGFRYGIVDTMHKPQALAHMTKVWRRATGLHSLPPDQQWWSLGSTDVTILIEPNRRTEMFLDNMRKAMAAQNFHPAIVYMDFEEHGVSLDKAIATAQQVIGLVADLAVLVVLIFPSSVTLTTIEADLHRLGYLQAAPTESSPTLEWVMYTMATSSFSPKQ